MTELELDILFSNHRPRQFGLAWRRNVPVHVKSVAFPTAVFVMQKHTDLRQRDLGFWTAIRWFRMVCWSQVWSIYTQCQLSAASYACSVVVGNIQEHIQTCISLLKCSATLSRWCHVWKGAFFCWRCCDNMPTQDQVIFLYMSSWFKSDNVKISECTLVKLTTQWLLKSTEINIIVQNSFRNTPPPQMFVYRLLSHASIFLREREFLMNGSHRGFIIFI